jgi:hypothetical protein
MGKRIARSNTPAVILIMDKKIWFKKKKYGWGWTPSTWQGTLVVGAYFFILCLTVWAAQFGFVSLSTTQLVAVLIGESALLVAISYLKGEKPSWNWGPPR